MYATERHDVIAQILQEAGRVAVADLSARLAVTTETVRRDLAELESRGILTRVHGGAIPSARSSTREPTLGERVLQHGTAKSDIARAALDLLEPGFRGSLFLDAGTSTAAVAALLPARLAEIGGRADIVTHSLSLAPDLAESDAATLTLIGGRIRGVTAAAVGAGTVAAIAALRPDIAFVGANGISSAFGLSTPDPEEAAVKRAIVAGARRVVVVCDASKFERELLVGFAGLDEIDVLITDEAPASALASALAEAEVEVRVA